MAEVAPVLVVDTGATFGVVAAVVAPPMDGGMDFCKGGGPLDCCRGGGPDRPPLAGADASPPCNGGGPPLAGADAKPPPRLPADGALSSPAKGSAGA